MTAIRLAAIQEELLKYGIVKDHMRNEHRRVEWRIACRGKCKTVLKMHWGPHMHPDAILKDMTRRGWQLVRNERPLCPECLHAISRKVKQLDTRSTTIPVPPEIVKPTPPTKTTSSILSELFKSASLQIAMEEDMPANGTTPDPFDNKPAPTPPPAPLTGSPSPAISRQVFGLLEDNLDEKVRTYRNGYSDARIAQEVGCHEQVVRDIRISAFCELIEDARISGLRADIEACETRLAKIVKTASDEIAALRSRLEQIAMTSRR